MAIILTIIFRVTSAAAKDSPYYFSQKYTVPEHRCGRQGRRLSRRRFRHRRGRLSRRLDDAGPDRARLFLQLGHHGRTGRQRPEHEAGDRRRTRSTRPIRSFSRRSRRSRRHRTPEDALKVKDADQLRAPAGICVEHAAHRYQRAGFDPAQYLARAADLQVLHRRVQYERAARRLPAGRRRPDRFPGAGQGAVDR